MANRKRPIELKVWVSKEENKMIRERIEASGIDGLGRYMRKMAIDGFVINVDHTDIKELTYEINKIGVNINQIAKKVNEKDYVSQRDIEETKELLDKIWELQRKNMISHSL